LESREPAFFFFVFLKERNEEESSGEEAILFEEVFLLTAHTFAESRHKLYVTKYHPLKQ
jgi:hypothetical protein